MPFVSVKDRIDCGTSTSRLFAYMLAALSEFEKDRSTDRSQPSRLTGAERGAFAWVFASARKISQSRSPKGSIGMTQSITTRQPGRHAAHGEPPGLGSLDHAIRRVPGGKRRVMELAPSAAEFEPRMLAVVEVWHRLTPRQHRTITLDEIATRGQMAPGEFLAAIVRAAFEVGSAINDLLVAAAHFPRS